MCSDVETIANFNHRPLYCAYGALWACRFLIRYDICYIISYELGSAIYWEHDRVSKHSDFHRERTSTTTLKMMSNFASMTKHFSLCSSRVLFALKKGSVYKHKIFEMYVNFTIVRWASFVRAIDEIQNGYLWDPYQPTAKVSSSHRWRLLHLCVCRLQMCWHQVRNWLFCFTKY